jgi:electron transfer flavoprotein alpha subunit
MSNGVLVFIEHRNGVLNKTSLEAIAAAQGLATSLQQPVSAVILGSDVDALAQEIAAYDLARVIKATNAKLADYTPDGYSEGMEHVVRQLDPQLVVLPHTYLVRDFAPKLAARFGKSLISDCIRGSGAPIEEMPVEVGEIRMTPEAPFQEVKQAVDLSKADVIVAVGRGIKSKDNLALAEKLAEVLGGDLAASRPICDAEWLPIDRQIGSSGQTVAPKLYVALGISGAIQHLVGMKNSGTIVAINKDPEAPIFDIADYGIVGDLFEAVPVLTEEIRKIKAGG